MNNYDIGSKRLNWIRDRDSTKDRTERLLLSLKIANYDLVVARQYGNREGAKKSRKQIKDIKRRLGNRKLKAELKAIDTLRKNLWKQIEYDKKSGVTFSFEKRNGQEYLYREKRGQKHKYVAKDWEDLDNKQHLEAITQVWNHSVLRRLSPSERKMLDIIKEETFVYSRAKDRDPLIEKYRKQLGLRIRCINFRGWRMITYTKKMTLKDIKNILRAVRKALIRRGNIDKKIESMAMTVGEGEESNAEGIEKLIVSIIRDSGVLNGVRTKGKRVRPIKMVEDYINDVIIRNPKSMYAILKPAEVKIFAENIIHKYKKMGGYIP